MNCDYCDDEALHSCSACGRFICESEECSNEHNQDCEAPAQDAYDDERHERERCEE